MRCNLVTILLLCLLVQSLQGALRPFNSEGHPEDTEYVFEKFSEGDDTEVYGLRQLRARRQSPGSDPEPYPPFSLPGDNHQYARVMYIGEGSKVIFVLTYDRSSSGTITSSKLYRSIDYGRTFQRVYVQFQSGYQLHNVIYSFPNNRTVMFADTTSSSLFVTTDEGKTFVTYDNIPVDPRTLKIHPTMPGWILGHDSYQGVLMYSKDFGANWDFVAQNVHPPRYSDYLTYDYTWGEPGVDWDTNQLDATQVFYSVVNPNLERNNRIIYVAKNSGSGYSRRVFDDNLGYIFTFILDGSYIFTDKYLCDGEEVELYVSYMRNPFIVARIPSTFSHYLYIVGSFRSSQALIIIQHDTHFTLYLSDETGTYYSLSLEDIVVGYGIDLEIIDSINGTMIANQFVRVGGSWRNQTLISFDNGARWQKIGAQTANCALPDCSLHFHMDTSTDYRRIGVYSRDSAPGLIVAHGNPGYYLTDTGSVYISRDGGLSWEQTLDYTWHVEIIDHGGLLVAAKDNHQDYSRTIKYSCDEGMNWSDFDFLDYTIVVWGIVTEPGETTTQVLLFGTQRQSASAHWIIIHINFASVFLRTCGASDYVNWTMSDERIEGQQCLLGEIRIIERRQPSVCCWNSRQYERLISATRCECTAADFECEWGYYRDENSGNCTLNFQYGPKLDCLTGYRKIAGDVCYEGASAQYLPPRNCALDNDNYSTPNDCAGTGKTSENSDDDSNAGTTAAIVVTVVVVVTVLIMIIILFALRLLLKLRHAVPSTTSTVTTTTTTANVSAKAAESNPYDEPPPYTVQNQPVVGGSMNYKSLKEEEAEEL